MINLQNKKLTKNLIFVILLTLFGCIFSYFFLYFERRIIGIDPFYHPDSLHYFSQYEYYTRLSFDDSAIQNLRKYFNSFFSNSLYPSIINLTHEIHESITNMKSLKFLHYTFYRYIITVNILISLLINLFIIIGYLTTFKENAYNKKNLIIFFIILFLPYKAHLSVNILKDIIILLPLVIFLTTKKLYSLIIGFMIATPLRYGAIIYYFLFVNFKVLNKKIFFSVLILSITISLILFFRVVYSDYDNTSNDLFISIKKFLTLRNEAEMGGRSFDSIPNFSEYKTGSLIRALVWPIFFITGSFSLFSDSFFMYLLTAEVIGVQFLLYFFYKKSIISINLILVLMIIGVYSNTFTAYFRYAYLAFYLSTLINFFNLDSSVKILKKVS